MPYGQLMKMAPEGGPDEIPDYIEYPVTYLM